MGMDMGMGMGISGGSRQSLSGRYVHRADGVVVGRRRALRRYFFRGAIENGGMHIRSLCMYATYAFVVFVFVRIVWHACSRVHADLPRSPLLSQACRSVSIDDAAVLLYDSHDRALIVAR